MLSGSNGVGFDTHQRHQGRDGALNPVAQRFGVISPVKTWGRSQGLQHRDRQAGLAAWRIHPALGRLPQTSNPVWSLPVTSQTIPPRGRHLYSISFHGEPLPGRLIGIEPGLKIGRAQIGKGEQEVAQISLGVDHNRGNTIQSSLF